jgi:hypothetical protein
MAGALRPKNSNSTASQTNSNPATNSMNAMRFKT